MEPERWKQIEELYHAVIEREPGDRAAFLDQAVAGDTALRLEVLALLRYDKPDLPFLEEPALELAAKALDKDEAKDQPTLRTGERIGSYTVISRLGAGGMGEVYLAEDLRLGRRVALKLLPQLFAQDEDRVRRFQQEARAASGLNHPNIITIYEVGQVDALHFIATEFIKGHTLRHVMAHTKVQPQDLLNIAIGVGSALAAAHEAGIVHRDIKPDNIMLRDDGIVKVLDFGLAKMTLRQAGEPDSGAATLLTVNTEPGIVMGTVRYMSPEQVRGIELDARSDLFSFGVVLYEMATGQLPFQGSTAAGIIEQIMNAQPEAIPRLNYAISAELERIIKKCLEKEMERRYQSAGDLVIDLKNLKRDANPKAEPVTHLRTRRSRRAIDSLAILPLENAGNDANAEYLSDGISESIINSLSQLPKLRVMARSTVFRYKGRDLDPQEVGRQLQVRAVLVGRIQQLGDRLIISLELVDTVDGANLWGGQYNRSFSDIFAVQEEVGKEIIEKLRLKLTVAEKKRLTKRFTENVGAYHSYLKGRYYWNKRTEAGLKQGIECFQQALNEDPNYALASSGLADSYSLLAEFGILLPHDAYTKAKAAVMIALKVDDTLAEAHASLGNILLMNDWDWSGAERELNRALELNPNYLVALYWYGDYFMLMGRWDEALNATQRAKEIDPLSLIINRNLGSTLYFARQYDKAVERFEEILRMDPGFVSARICLGLAHRESGNASQAIEIFEDVRASNDTMQIRGMLGTTYALSGRSREAHTILEQFKEEAQQRYVSSYIIATIHACLGESETAFEWLEKAYDERATGLVWIKIDPALDSLRSDARFTSLLERIGFAGS